MAFFNRKHNDPTVLPEVEKYYEAEKRERMGLAWLLAVISIACIALLLIGAFFGGRWIYRKASHSDKTQGVVATATSGAEIGKPKEDTTDSTKTPKTPATPSKNETAPKTPAVPNPTPSTPAPAPTTPQNGSSKLANTGPENTVAVFIISVIGFTGLHSFISKRSARNN